jgi:TniQ protein/Tn7-like transposition protein D
MGNFCLRLFGDEHARAKIDLPDRLAYLAQKIPGAFHSGPEEIAYRLTLLPYYEPFLRESLGVHLRQAMLYPNTGHRTIPSLSPLKVKSPSHLRCCYKCWLEDSTSRGELYWRRSHQIPGSGLCPVHGLPLVWSPVSWSYRSSWQRFYDASSVDLRSCRQQPSLPGKEAVHRSLSRDVVWLLNNRSGLTAEHLGPAYWDALRQRGLTRKMSLRLEAIKTMVIEKIGASTLRALKSDLRPSDDFDWLSQLVRPSRVRRAGQPPLRHLLLIQSLDHTAESFFAAVKERTTDSSSIYEEEVAKNLGVWWFDRAISTNEIGRRLDMTPETVNAVAAKQGLPFPRGGFWGRLLRWLASVFPGSRS